MLGIKLDHVPLLEGNKNYSEWAKSMHYALLTEDLWTYISEGTNPIDILEFGTARPALTEKSTSEDLVAAQSFMINDAKANSVIRRRLSSLVTANLPMKCDDSARETWRCLHDSHGKVDVTAQFALRSHMTSLKLTGLSDVDRYLGEINTGRVKFMAMGINYTDAEAIYQTLLGIPDTGTWGMFKQVTLSAVANASSTGTPLTFDQIAGRIEVEGIRTRLLSKTPGPGSQYANPAREIHRHKNNPNGVLCTNPICASRGQQAEGHDLPHCWQLGGGMAGSKPEWMQLRDKEKEKNHQGTTSQPLAASAREESASLTLPISVPPSFKLPGFYLLPTCDADLSCAVLPELALLSQHHFQSLLDSGATSHLIRDRSLFWSFDPTQAASVRTANHGTLDTLGRGDCIAILRWKDKSVRLKLCGCLLAPSAVINLVSVGCLVDSGFGCTFDDGKVSIVAPFPSGRGVCYEGALDNCLTFISLEFLHPQPASSGDELAAFSKVSLTPDIWHACMGHAGGGRYLLVSPLLPRASRTTLVLCQFASLVSLVNIVANLILPPDIDPQYWLASCIVTSRALSPP